MHIQDSATDYQHTENKILKYKKRFHRFKKHEPHDLQTAFDNHKTEIKSFLTASRIKNESKEAQT